MPPRYGRLNPQRRAMASQQQQIQQEQQQQFTLDIVRVLEDRIAAIQKVYEEKARSMESAFEQRLADIQKAHEQSLSDLERLHMPKFVNAFPGQAEGIQNVSAEKVRFESELRKVELKLAGAQFENHIPRLDGRLTAVDITMSCLKLQKRCLQLQLMELTRDSTEIALLVDLEMMDGTEVDPRLRSPLMIKIDHTRTMNDLRAAIERDLQSPHGDYMVVWLGTEFLFYASALGKNQYDSLLQSGIVEGSIATARIMPGTPTWPW